MLDYQYELMRKILGDDSKVKLYKVFNGVPNSRINPLLNIKPKFDYLKVITIADCTTKDRIITKGLDLTINYFKSII